MSGMLDKNILNALYRANFEKITAYILDICSLIVEDYERKQLKLPNDENKIRSIMLEEYMKKLRRVFMACQIIGLNLRCQRIMLEMDSILVE